LPFIYGFGMKKLRYVDSGEGHARMLEGYAWVFENEEVVKLVRLVLQWDSSPLSWTICYTSATHQAASPGVKRESK
jgi:hypothetical protein